MEVIKTKVSAKGGSASGGKNRKLKLELKQKKIPHWLDENHPNYSRWKRARNLYLEKGEVVENVLTQYTKLVNLRILDIGCGNGGTSLVLSKENFVVSLEIDLLKLKVQNTESKRLINADAIKMPFKNSSFDIIILQDVIEHVLKPGKLINSCAKLLKENGILYLSTPNRISLLNLISDPHWGLPLLSLFNRNIIRKYFLRFFRKKDINRKDIAQLFSLNQIGNLLQDNFRLNLNTRNVVAQLLNGKEGIVWSNFHLFLIRLLNSLKMKRVFLNLSNDKFGIINKYLTPTFYIVAQKQK